MVVLKRTVDSPCALLVDIAARDAIDAPSVRSAHVSHTQAAAARPAASAAASAATSSRRPARRRASSSCSLKKKNSATQNEKTTLKTKKNRKAEKHLKLGLPALKLAIAQNPIKGFFKAFFDFSPAEGSVTYAENTISTRK